MKRILTILLLIVIVGGGALTWFVTRLPSSPFDERTANLGISPEVLAAGERVAHEDDCVACHTTHHDGELYAGGMEMSTPLGSIYVTNITPDVQSGIGSYSLADFDRSVRLGVIPEGHSLYPAMPYPSYATMTDEDIDALYGYCMNEVPAVEQANRPSDIPWPLALSNAVFTDSGTYEPDPTRSEDWNRGAYLVQGAGHCGTCHTPRAVTMQERGYDEDSQDFLAGSLLDGWYAPSLRQDHNTGLGRWDEDDIFTFLDQGRNRHSVVFGSMAEAYKNSLQFIDDDDLRAIAIYLKTLPGTPDRERRRTDLRRPLPLLPRRRRAGAGTLDFSTGRCRRIPERRCRQSGQCDAERLLARGHGLRARKLPHAALPRTPERRRDAELHPLHLGQRRGAGNP